MFKQNLSWGTAVLYRKQNPVFGPDFWDLGSCRMFRGIFGTMFGGCLRIVRGCVRGFVD